MKMRLGRGKQVAEVLGAYLCLNYILTLIVIIKEWWTI